MSTSAEPTNHTVVPSDGADRAAALVLAGVGIVVTLALVVGAWTPWSSPVGVVFLVITWAVHRAAPTTRTPRSALIRFAFGSVSALCIFLAAGWLMMSLWPAAGHHGWVLGLIWVVLAAAISLWEPRIARWLDRERRKA